MSKTYLKNYNARWYDPSLGHFAQADSIITPAFRDWTATPTSTTRR